MPVILICEQLRQRDCDSEANLGSIVRLCLIKMSQRIVKQNKTKQKKLASKIVWSVKCSLCKRGDLSSIPRTYIKSQIMHIYNLRVGEQRQEAPWSSLSQPQPAGQTPGNERPCLKKQGLQCSEE